MPVKRFNFSLDVRADADVIAWLESQSRGRRSEAIAEALRSHVSGSGVATSLGSADRLARRIALATADELQRRGLVARPGGKGDDLPDDLASALLGVGR